MYMINRRGREDIIYWRCHRSRNSHCTGSITTGPGDAIVSVKDTHNHPPDQASIEVKIKVISGNFPPALWNISEIGDCRTNNNLEGWHSKLVYLPNYLFDCIMCMLVIIMYAMYFYLSLV